MRRWPDRRVCGLPLRVGEPFGAEQIVAVTSQQRMVDLETALMQFNRRRASGQVIEESRALLARRRADRLDRLLQCPLTLTGSRPCRHREPIRQARPWLAFLLLLAGSGAAPAAPLPTASLHVGTTYARWLWPVQAVRGQTNTASVSLQILPSQTVNVGGKVSFGVTARKTGYLILVDVDAEGRMSQIFPTPELLAQSNERDINLVKPGVEFVVPPRRRGSVVLNMSSHRRPGPQ